jgi:hypothetical protein
LEEACGKTPTITQAKACGYLNKFKTKKKISIKLKNNSQMTDKKLTTLTLILSPQGRGKIKIKSERKPDKEIVEKLFEGVVARRETTKQSCRFRRRMRLPRP